jgi:hypothetical protein
MRIVENRAGRNAELKMTGRIHALVDEAGGYRFGFEFARLAILNLAAGLSRLIPGDVLAVALQATDAIWPAHSFEVVNAGFLGRELLCYVYQVHFRDLYT